MSFERRGWVLSLKNKSILYALLVEGRHLRRVCGQVEGVGPEEKCGGPIHRCPAGTPGISVHIMQCTATQVLIVECIVLMTFSNCINIFLSSSILLSFYLSVCLSKYLSNNWLNTYLSIYLNIYLSIYIFIYIYNIHTYSYYTIYIYVLYICIFVSINTHSQPFIDINCQSCLKVFPFRWINSSLTGIHSKEQLHNDNW